MTTDRPTRTVPALALAVVAVCLSAFAGLAAVVVTHRSGLALDRRAWRWCLDHRGDTTVTLFRAVSHLGDPVVLLVLAVVAGGWFAHRRSPVAGGAPLAALAGASLTEMWVKAVVGRTRPPVAGRLLTETGPSFPSGHTTGTAALFLAVAVLVAGTRSSRVVRVTVVVGAGLVAALVGVARLVLGVHWLTDVLAGLLLGASWALGVVAALPVVEARAATALARAPVRPVRRAR